MPTSWPEEFLQRLQSLNVQEAPHGLYGIRHAYSSDANWVTLAHVLASPKKTNFLRAHYQSRRSVRPEGDVAEFSVNGRLIHMRVLDFATTKVRSFGGGYRLDPRYEKETTEPPWKLEKLLTQRLGDPARCSENALLLVLHVASEKEIASVIGRATERDFLNRYQLELASLRWLDARGFLTTLWLWLNLHVEVG